MNPLPVLLAVVVASFAPATMRVGLREATELEPAAAAVAGKPVTVLCATDMSAWVALGHGSANGFADIPNATAYLSPEMCAGLDAWPRTPVWKFGWTLLALVHEATHLTGETSESKTECRALAVLPSVAVRWFVTRDRFEMFTSPVLARVADAAWAAHRLKPPDYTSDC